MNTLHVKSQSNDQFFKMRIEDLEKQLDVRNSRIDNLCKELKDRSDELARQEEKHRSVCEARDESKFRVVQLEGEMKVLRTENENLKYQLKEQKEVKNSRELALEALVASYADQIKKYEEKLKVCDSKISQLETVKNANSFSSERSFEKSCFVSNNEEGFKLLQLENDVKLLGLENEDLKSQLSNLNKERKNTRIETLETLVKSYAVKLQKYEETIKIHEFKIIELEAEKKEMACRSEKHINEVKDLQCQLASHETCKKILEVEKTTNIQLQKELENLKSLCKKQILTEIPEATQIMPDTGLRIKGVSELQECGSILLSFVEQQRNLHMKFEQEVKERLPHLQESILMTKNLHEVPKGATPVNPQDLLQKVEKAQEFEIKLVKEDLSKCPPLTSQNRRHQKTVKTQVKESESQKPVTSNAANAVPQKKNAKKNKKIKDENEYPPTDQNFPVSVNSKTPLESLSSNQNQGRQLRARRKV